MSYRIIKGLIDLPFLIKKKLVYTIDLEGQLIVQKKYPTDYEIRNCVGGPPQTVKMTLMPSCSFSVRCAVRALEYLNF